MKVIDLLNKIANGEIDRNNKYQFSRDDYCTINDFFARYIVDKENLNLEIIEEHKISEKLNLDTDKLRGKETPRTIDYLIEDKINEIIDYLEEIK